MSWNILDKKASYETVTLITNGRKAMRLYGRISLPLKYFRGQLLKSTSMVLQIYTRTHKDLHETIILALYLHICLYVSKV